MYLFYNKFCFVFFPDTFFAMFQLRAYMHFITQKAEKALEASGSWPPSEFLPLS